MATIARRPLDALLSRFLPRVDRASNLHQPDYWLLTVILVLVMFGTVMVFSSSFAIGVQDAEGNGYYYLTRHLMYLVVGMAGMLVALSVDYHFWRRFSLLFMVGAVVLLVIMVIFPALAPEAWGASRWITIGPISFQPSEFAKLAMIIYLADWLSQKGNRVRELSYGLIPFVLMLGFLIALLMGQPDLGTSMLVSTVGVSMFLVAGANMFHLTLAGIVGVAGFLALALSAEYRRDRIFIFLNPDADMMNLGWQLTQAKIAIGSGGLLGLGLGASRQKFSWLPAAHNDAIFAIIAEELGLIGCAFVLMLFITLAWRGYQVAMRAPDTFGTLIAVGIVTWMIFQAALNIGGVTTTIPFTGIPIPFLSYGGSSLAVSLTAMGVLLNISRQTREPGTRQTVGGPQESSRILQRHPASDARRSEPVSVRNYQAPRTRAAGPETGSAQSFPSRRTVKSNDGKSRSSGGQFGRGSEPNAKRAPRRKGWR